MNRFQLSLGQQTDVLVLKVNHAIHIISYSCLQVQMRLVFQQVYLSVTSVGSALRPHGYLMLTWSLFP